MIPELFFYFLLLAPSKRVNHLAGFVLIEPPTFTKKLENTATVMGQKAEFQCVVAGSKTLSVLWQKDDSWILEDPKIQRTFENNVAILRIPVCEVKHGGKYSCQVANEAGQDKCFATLEVQGMPCFYWLWSSFFIRPSGSSVID